MPVGAVPFPFGMCRICKDKATGIHYGVATCEGCKGFFKRSITRGDKYKCFFGGECDINPKNRNRCKSCRFQRCIEVGMSVEAVRMGRIPKVDKEKALEAFQQGGSDYSKLELKVESTGGGTYGFKINSVHVNNETHSKNESKINEESAPLSQDALGPKPVSDCTTTTLAQNPMDKDSCLNNYENLVSSVNSLRHSSSSVNAKRRSCTVTYSSLESMDHDGLVVDKYNSNPNLGNMNKFSYNQDIPNSCMNLSSDSYQRKDETVLRSDVSQQDLRQNQLMNLCYNERQAFPQSNNHFVSPSKQLSHSSYNEIPLWDLSNTVSKASTNYMTEETVHGQTFDSRIVDLSQHGVSQVHNHSEGQVHNLGVSQVHRHGVSQVHNQGHNHYEGKMQNHGESKTYNYGDNVVHDLSTSIGHNSFVDIVPFLEEGQHKSLNHAQIHNENNSKLHHNSAHFTKSEMTQCSEYGQVQQFEHSNSQQFERTRNNSNGTDNYRFGGHDANPQTASDISPLPAHSDKQFERSVRYFPQSCPNAMLDRSSLENNVSQRESDTFSPMFTELSETESHSIEAVRCPTPVGSVISGSSSNSSQKSVFCPSIIQLLVDELLKSNDSQTVKKRMVEKFENRNVDKYSMFRMLHVIEQAEKSKKRLSDFSDTESTGEKLSALPVYKKECLERFISDVDDEMLGNPSSAEELNKSFGNLDVQQAACMTDKRKDLSSRNVNKQDPGSVVLNLAESSSSGVVAEKSMKQKPEFHGDHENNFGDVSSSCTFEEDKEKEKKIRSTLVSMNLAQKILNRFKPEHREKIKLYMDGELYIKVLTDSEEDIKEVYNKLISGIPGLNDRILGFCEHVPGFSSLSSEDQEKLVKRSYYDLWTLSYAEYFQDGKSYWILPSGEIYSAEAMRKILNDEMVDTIFKFAKKFNDLKITDLEMGILGAVRLTSTDDVELNDISKVQSIHSHLLDTLAHEVKIGHRHNHSRILIEVFSLVPLMDSVNRIQREIIANFSTKGLDKKT